VNIKKAVEETGKHFLNVAVALIIFAILQPIIKGEFNLKTGIIFVTAYIVILLIGNLLIAFGGKDDG